MRNRYHHGDLKRALVQRGIEALSSTSRDTLSLRSLAAELGVSKNAPYRHFRDREHFMGALINEGFRLLLDRMTTGIEALPPEDRNRRNTTIAAMGRAYMEFAVAHEELYRLMNSPLACSLEEEHDEWPRKALEFLAAGLSGSPETLDVDDTAATWAYIHGLVLLRIDRLFPAHLPEPDWSRLSGAAANLRVHPDSTGNSRRTTAPPSE